MNVTLLAPPPANPFTGGHLFNSRVAEACGGSCELVHVSADAARARLARASCGDDVSVLDSLFLAAIEPTDWRGRRVLQLVHSLPQDRDVAPRVDAALAGAAGCITTSAFMARVVRARGGARAAVCTPGVAPLEDGAAEPEVWPARGARLLSVANFEPRKGHLELLRVLERLDDLAWSWLVVGDPGADPECAARFAAALAASPVQERVRVLGRQEPVAVQRLLAAADVFALLSVGEPYGMVYAESVARGTPVVAWNDGGVPESVVHGSTGLLAPCGDLHAASRHLRTLLADQGLRERMHRACSGVRFPTWRECADRFLACCASLAQVEAP